MLKTAGIVVLGAALSACASPVRTANLGAPFDSVAAQRMLVDGPNLVRGSAFLRQQGGGVVTCAGADVALIPATLYARRLFSELYGPAAELPAPIAAVRIPLPVNVEPKSDQFGQLVRRAQCDAQGNFSFDRVADGEWFVETKVTWMVAGVQQGGAVMRRVSVAGGAVSVIVAP